MLCLSVPCEFNEFGHSPSLFTLSHVPSFCVDHLDSSVAQSLKYSLTLAMPSWVVLTRAQPFVPALTLAPIPNPLSRSFPRFPSPFGQGRQTEAPAFGHDPATRRRRGIPARPRLHAMRAAAAQASSESEEASAPTALWALVSKNGKVVCSTRPAKNPRCGNPEPIGPCGPTPAAVAGV